MLLAYRDGYIVIASPMATVVNKDRVIVKMKESEEVLIKEIRFRGDTVELISCNGEHTPPIKK